MGWRSRPPGKYAWERRTRPARPAASLDVTLVPAALVPLARRVRGRGRQEGPEPGTLTARAARRMSHLVLTRSPLWTNSPHLREPKFLGPRTCPTVGLEAVSSGERARTALREALEPQSGGNHDRLQRLGKRGGRARGGRPAAPSGKAALVPASPGPRRPAHSHRWASRSRVCSQTCTLSRPGPGHRGHRELPRRARLQWAGGGAAGPRDSKTTLGEGESDGESPGGPGAEKAAELLCPEKMLNKPPLGLCRPRPGRAVGARALPRVARPQGPGALGGG